ncbi:hypothetical protein LZG04_03950 [Saccharothrix sp. S26]|uniref:PEP-utilizing enzyme n=1 Tax=Saccharothrix sp. S26 TaxID=2907215 RepID=UPI001F36D91E|nr:PEP-utilizing enzyme [Saccharothrix sp. S26]MCE6993968.1 hypothetical protein [Saccharothrix sp. S26]
MTTLPSFSLDTPFTDRNSVHSGHNFREVAPELLSPLTWSIIGAGMEQGFRAAADKFGRERPRGARPHFVSYFGFRPFFNMTTVERLADELPLVAPEDIWELLLGGPAPDVKREKRPSQLHRLSRLAGGLKFLASNAEAFGRAHADLAAAEQATMDAVESGGAWQSGVAVEAAIRAGRSAWALHIRTTCVAFVASAAAKRILQTQYDEGTALELLRASAHREDDGQNSSAGAGALTVDLDRMNNYEVADATPAFARFGSASLSSAASLLRAKPAQARPEVVPDHVGVPFGTALGPVYERMVKFMGLGLGEREKSKEIGLRALHCTRVLLDRGAFGAEPEEAAMLGVHELRSAGSVERKRLAAQRSEELAEAAALDYPTDLHHQSRGLTEARRPRRTAADTGTALAPGWAEGTLVRESDGEEGRIVVGDRVDGNYVLAVLPDGVVSKYGSVLSHVAIVCRELGIPFVAGVSVPDVDLGKHAVVDGWTGAVTISRAQQAAS